MDSSEQYRILMRILEIVERDQDYGMRQQVIERTTSIVSDLRGNVALNEAINVEVAMGDVYKTYGQSAAVGRGAHAHDINFHQMWNASSGAIDLDGLETDLSKLFLHCRDQAIAAEHDGCVAAIVQAQMAAKRKDGPAALEALSRAGRWTFEQAEKIGVGVATAAIKVALGL